MSSNELKIEQGGDTSAKRALFEAWAVSDDGGWTHAALARNPEGDEFDYRDDDVQAEWRAWQGCTRLAATTQASTAQAEQGSAMVKHGDMPSIEITLRQAKELVDCFGGNDAEISIIRRPAAWVDMPDGLYAYFSEYPEEGSMYLGETEVQDEDDIATSSTDAQAAAQVRDRLADLEAQLAACMAQSGQWAAAAGAAHNAALEEAAKAVDTFVSEQLDDERIDCGRDIAAAIRALRAGDTGGA